jgi:mannose-6-phosphate isomerase-like protein (cupin superfamily)
MTDVRFDDPGRRALSRLLSPVLLVTLVLTVRLTEGQPRAGGIQEQVVVDNDTVRVALLLFPPGSASGEHVGLDPELGIVLEGELTLLTAAGREVLGPGAVRWLPALVSHDARNEGTVPLKLWVVLVKK